MLFCFLNHVINFFLIHIRALRHPEPKRPFRNHRNFAHLCKVALQQRFVILSHPDHIIEHFVVHTHVIGHIGKASHFKFGSRIRIQKNRITAAAHEIRMIFVGLFRIGAQCIRLPAMDRLAPFSKIGKLFAEAVKLFIRIQIHRLVHAGHCAILIHRKSNRKIFAHVVNVGIVNLLFRF